MSIVSVEVMSRKEFTELNFRSNRELPEHVAAISITDPETNVPCVLAARIKKVIRLQFWDVTHLVAGYEPATQVQVKQVYDFIQELVEDEKPWHLICHCEAGISRSAAVVAFVVWRLGLPFDMKRLEHANVYILTSLKALLPGYYTNDIQTLSAH